jgi:hypothetical protein
MRLGGSAEPGEEGGAPWPTGLTLATLAVVTVLVALVSEVFVESVQEAALAFGMTPAFSGRSRYFCRLRSRLRAIYRRARFASKVPASC